MDIIGWILGVLGLGVGVWGEMRARRAERREREAEQRMMARFDSVDQQLREQHNLILQRDGRGIPTGDIRVLTVRDQGSLGSRETAHVRVLPGDVDSLPISLAPPLEDSEDDEEA